MNEAKARIKINKLLEDAGWRFFDDGIKKANIILEQKTKITTNQIDEFGEDFEKTTNGFLDFLLLDAAGKPFIVLEAKSEKINPLFAKEQARTYASSQNCRFIILSNGNVHYFWDLQRGNPNLITKFPLPETIKDYDTFKPNPQSLINEILLWDYIVRTQKPNYDKDPAWNGDDTQRNKYLEDNKLKFLRPFQLKAVKSIQDSVKNGIDRFLFEMATGTGKTLTAAAVIKLFLRTGNVKRVLFLVDRLELEDQADKAFKLYLRPDYKSVIYKENRDDWRKAEIVVSTVQSLLFNNKYLRLFSPTDFDLVISDEAHRSIGGNSRNVFEYFIGYKLGLTATPKNYLKNINSEKLNQNDPRELERRMLLDTYRIFGCENGVPTFQYSLIDGVKDGYLINPKVFDARTEITTELLSEKGYSVLTIADDGDEDEQTFFQTHFEKKFFSETTNRIFCKTFIDKALKDPVTNEIGKSIVFCVSQNHAAKITQILNEFADKLYPGKYNSDFAVQVTSKVTDAQQYTINFTNNNLNGSGNFNPDYKTSKSRVCVTVGMMTTGYDCQDILNICLMRPIFSPTDFIQIKGRGTRKYNFLQDLIDEHAKQTIINQANHVNQVNHGSDSNHVNHGSDSNHVNHGSDKKIFHLFDFFGNYEYFEFEFKYDEVIKLPALNSLQDNHENPLIRQIMVQTDYENYDPDPIKTLAEENIGPDGMKIDRMYFQKFEDKVKQDDYINTNIQLSNWEGIYSYITKNIFEKPEEYFNIDKLRQAVKVDRRLSLREILEKIFGLIPYFKTKQELLNDEYDKFDALHTPDEKYFKDAKDYFISYISNPQFREIIESKQFALLNTLSSGDTFRKLPPDLRTLIPEYIKDNVPINKYMN